MLQAAVHNAGPTVPLYHYCVCSDKMPSHTVLWFCMVIPAGIAYGNRIIESYAQNMRNGGYFLLDPVNTAECKCLF